jgi:hypothetical protein
MKLIKILSKNIKKLLNNDLLITNNDGHNSLERLSVDVEDIKELTNTEKKYSIQEMEEIILNDSHFGMFSLYKFHYNTIRDKEFSKIYENYPSSIFTLILMLPILVFICQWLIYLSFISYQINNYNKNFCPNSSSYSHKFLMIGIGLIYFIRSFYLWDYIIKKIILKKTFKMNSISAIIDKFHELFFSLIVYLANIWISYIEDDINNIILNSLAMEFLMDLDNLFKQQYFEKLPNKCIEYIYNKFYVSSEENIELINNRNDKCFLIVKKIFYFPYKLLIILILIFPILCFILIFVGAFCK